MQVDHFSWTAQDLKPMRTPRGDQQGQQQVVSQGDCMPTQEGQRSVPQIDDHIMDGTTRTGDHLPVTMRWCLEVHAAHGADGKRAGTVCLGDHSRMTERGQFIHTEETLEGSPHIDQRLAADDHQSGNRCRLAEQAPIHELMTLAATA